jgi:uncharacterized membrane protein
MRQMSDMAAKTFMTIFGSMGWGFIALQFWLIPDIALWRRVAASILSAVVVAGIFWCAKSLFGERW